MHYLWKRYKKAIDPHRHLLAICQSAFVKERWPIAFLFMLRLISVGCSIALPWVAGRFIETLAKGPTWDLIIRFAGISSALWISDSIFNSFSGVVSRKSSSRFAYGILKGCSKHVWHTTLALENGGSATADRISKDCEQLAAFIYSIAINIFSKILFAIGLSVMLMKVSVWAFGVTLCLSLLSLIPMKLFRQKLAEATHRLQKCSSKFVGFFYQQFENFRNIKRNRLSHSFEIATDRMYEQVLIDIVKQAKVSAWLDFTMSLSRHFVTAMATLAIGAEFIRGSITLGGFTAAHSYAMSFSGTIDFFLGLGKSWIVTKTAVERLSAIIAGGKYNNDGCDINNSIDDVNNKSTLLNCNNTVDTISIFGLQTVVGFESPKTISYDDHIFKKGSFHCIVGESGCGKSTFLDILCGVCPIIKGKIVFKQEKNILKPEKISFAFVDQECELLFHEPTDILSFGGRSNVDDVHKLLSYLNLTERIKKFQKTEGESTPSVLSQGEKQRLCIARALATNANVLLFDEPTAALDTGMREKVSNLLCNEARNRIVIAVTHDPNLIACADKVYRIESSMRGNHD